jgi:hypothetical protein
LVLTLAVLALVARIVLVEMGVRYGIAAVSRADRIIAGSFSLGLALTSAAVARKHQKSHGSGSNDKPSTFVDGVAVFAAIGSVVAVLVLALNLFAPAERADQAKPTCAGARTLRTKYDGITTGPEGNNSRSGPARSFPANGRFAQDCSNGFSVYCLGHPIEDSAGTTTHQRWLTRRWLLVAKQPPGLRAWLARILSGEKPDPQFVTDANIAPATSYEDLKPANAATCSANYGAPGKAILQINTRTIIR